MARIAQDIEMECVTEEHDFMGDWVAIGGFFILLLTGRGSSALQPSNLNLGSSQS